MRLDLTGSPAGLIAQALPDRLIAQALHPAYQ
jgi:hypothetical protein